MPDNPYQLPEAEGDRDKRARTLWQRLSYELLIAALVAIVTAFALLALWLAL